MSKEIDLRQRGSSLLLQAWESGEVVLNDEVVTGLSEVLNGIQGRVETAQVLGEERSAVRVGIAYDDDTPRCGNDLSLILRALSKFDGVIPVHIIINGIPAVDSLRLDLQVGNA